jgi:hypothetical protein
MQAITWVAWRRINNVGWIPSLFVNPS